MKFVFLLASIFAASISYAQEFREICYTDTGVCLKAKFYDKSVLGEILLRFKDYEALDPQIQKEYSGLNLTGSLAALISDIGYAETASALTEYRNAAADINDLSSIPDETWDAVMSGGACFGAVVGCAATTYTAVMSGGLAIFGAQFTCAGGGFLCVNAIRSFQKWQHWQRRLKEAEKNPPPASTGSMGSSGLPTSPRPIAEGPIYPPEPTHGGNSTIHEPGLGTPGGGGTSGPITGGSAHN